MCDYNEFREEDGYQNEIPRWVWFTGQFLFRFQETLENRPQMTVTRFWDDFKNSQGLQNCQGFHLKNQGTLLMLLYGLLVVPREMWNYQGLPEFQFDTRNEFQFCIGDENLTATNFLKYMRHAIAHANFEIIDLNNGIYEFWSVRGDGDVNFKVRINHCGLGKFVTEVGQYYINQVAPYILNAHAE